MASHRSQWSHKDLAGPTSQAAGSPLMGRPHLPLLAMGSSPVKEGGLQGSMSRGTGCATGWQVTPGLPVHCREKISTSNDLPALHGTGA
jgi:hypothetical protein